MSDVTIVFLSVLGRVLGSGQNKKNYGPEFFNQAIVHLVLNWWLDFCCQLSRGVCKRTEKGNGPKRNPTDRTGWVKFKTTWWNWRGISWSNRFNLPLTISLTVRFLFGPFPFRPVSIAPTF